MRVSPELYNAHIVIVICCQVFKSICHEAHSPQGSEAGQMSSLQAKLSGSVECVLVVVGF